MRGVRRGVGHVNEGCEGVWGMQEGVWVMQQVSEVCEYGYGESERDIG